MITWQRGVACALVGVFFRVLVPEEPQSVILTVLANLILWFGFWWRD